MIIKQKFISSQKSMEFITNDRLAKVVKEYEIEEVHECPICHAHIAPILLSSVYYIHRMVENNLSPTGVCTYQCNACCNAFVVQYTLGKSLYPVAIGPIKITDYQFSDSIQKTSRRFIDIYNQALYAETMGLNEICGVGYRLALECLIKDYLIKQHPEQKDAIVAESLGSCIRNRIDNGNLQIVAGRAAWLGNDYAHYAKKFEERNLNDFKTLIHVAVAWIDMEVTTDVARGITRR